MRARKSIPIRLRTVAATAAVFMFASTIATAAQAANFSASVQGSQAWTTSHSSVGERAIANVEDTAADSRAAENRFRRVGGSRQNVTATGGYGSTANSGHSQSKIWQQQACTVNANPFQPRKCGNVEEHG